MNKNPIRTGFLGACTPVVTPAWNGRGFRERNVRRSGRLAVRFTILCHSQTSRVDGWGRRCVGGTPQIGEICLGRGSCRQVVGGCEAFPVGYWSGLRLIYMAIREGVVRVLFEVVGDDPRIEPSQGRLFGFIQNIFPNIVPLNVESMSRTSTLRVPHRLFIRCAERGEPLQSVLASDSNSRIARVGVRKGVVSEWVLEHLGPRHAHIAHILYLNRELFILPMPSIA